MVIFPAGWVTNNQPSAHHHFLLMRVGGVVGTNLSRQVSSPSQDTETPSTPTQWHVKFLFIFLFCITPNPHVGKLTRSRFIFNSLTYSLYSFHQVWVCLLRPAVKRWIPNVVSCALRGHKGTSLTASLCVKTINTPASRHQIPPMTHLKPWRRVGRWRRLVNWAPLMLFQ